MGQFQLPDLTALEPYLGKEAVQYLMSGDPLINSAIVVILSFVVATIALYILKFAATRIATKTKTRVDDEILKAMEKPVFRLIILGGLYIAISLLEPSAITDFSLRAIISAAYLIITFFVLEVIDIIVNDILRELAKRTESSMDDEIVPIFHRAAKIVVWIFAIILILGVWGVDVAPFLAGLGIAGLAISFALKETLSNIISGISLIMDHAFRVGDKVQLDSGESGVIHEITLRSTRIKTYDNEIIIIPNNHMAAAKIKNYTQPTLDLRVVVPFSVAYGADPDKVKKIVLKTLQSIEGVLKEPKPDVIFKEMGEYALNFEARFWVGHYNEAFSKKLEATDKIYKTLNKHKIEIPFPTRTVYLREEKKR